MQFFELLFILESDFDHRIVVLKQCLGWLSVMFLIIFLKDKLIGLQKITEYPKKNEVLSKIDKDEIFNCKFNADLQFYCNLSIINQLNS